MATSLPLSGANVLDPGSWLLLNCPAAKAAGGKRMLWQQRSSPRKWYGQAFGTSPKVATQRPVPPVPNLFAKGAAAVTP